MLATEDLVQRAFGHHQAGELDAAAPLYREALEIDGGHLNALQLLGVLTLAQGQADEALALLTRAAARVPEHARGHRQFSSLYNNLGNALSAAGRRAEAVAAYRRGLELAPDDPEVQINLAATLLAEQDWQGAIAYFEAALRRASRADWHHRLGLTYAKVDRIDDARAAYEAALATDASFAPALYDLALLQLQLEQPREAIALLERLRQADPSHIDVHRTLGDAYRGAGLLTRAISAYRQHLALLPKAWVSLLYLGMTLSEIGRHDEAIVCAEQAIAMDASQSAIGPLELGNILLRAERHAEAQQQYLRAFSLEPFVTRSATFGKAKFSALFLIAPGCANTPYAHLVGRCDYDVNFVAMLQDKDYDIAILRANADVVVNLVSDADQGEAVLPVAAGLIQRLAKPTINVPANVLRTRRETMARAAAEIPHCRAPRTVRLPGQLLLAEDPPADLAPFQAPFLVRITGLHGGEAFEMVRGLGELRVFVGQQPRADYYVMDYLDTRSADGYFRKYRFFYVDGVLMPYHLAIGSQWKVHQFSTNIANETWMQAEEERFLETPEAVFGQKQMEALHKIGGIAGLDFMGIDCALGPDGNVVLFEANATMLVNGNTHDFPYKIPYVRRIKAAFDALLERQATGRSH